jgi:hypothetical protein
LLAERPTRPVWHTVDVSAYLTASHLVVPTAGQMLENLVVLVPAAGPGVLFAGAMASFGVTPNAFDGDPGAWADALGDLAELAAVVVPGIGPVGGSDELIALQAYLYACVDAEGDPAGIPPGPWDRWTDRHLDEESTSSGRPCSPPASTKGPAVDAAPARPRMTAPTRTCVDQLALAVTTDARRVVGVTMLRSASLGGNR